MLTAHELTDLVRTLGSANVLSVYLDTREHDPAMRDAWRARLATALRAARVATPEHERPAFDRAATLLADSLANAGSLSTTPGWAAFVTEHTTHHAAELPVRPGTLVEWRDGPVVTPYLRALKQQSPVIVALIESGSATLYRYERGSLEPLGSVAAPDTADPAASTAVRAAPRGSARPAPRSAVATEAAHRRRVTTFDRLVPRLAAVVTPLVGDDGWLLVGGTAPWAFLAAQRLPSHLATRAITAAALSGAAPPNDIAAAAKQAASTLRSRTGLPAVNGLVEHAGGGASRAAAGVPAVQRALVAGAVDRLVLSPEFARRERRLAEDMVRAALAQGADVEILSSAAAEHLRHAADGIAAQLRYPIEAPPSPRVAADGAEPPRPAQTPSFA